MSENIQTMRRLAVDHAAEMVLIEADYCGGVEHERVQGAYSMAVELLCVILDIDAEPVECPGCRRRARGEK